MVKRYWKWPVAAVVDKVMRLIVKRRREVLVPWLAGPLLLLDKLLGSWIGDRILKRKFPPES